MWSCAGAEASIEDLNTGVSTGVAHVCLVMMHEIQDTTAAGRSTYNLGDGAARLATVAGSTLVVGGNLGLLDGHGSRKNDGVGVHCR